MHADIDTPRLVLASASPRRRAIVQALGMPCMLVSADIDEAAIPYKSPRELAIKAAYAKACAVEERIQAPAIIISADTIVVVDDKLFGKPGDEAEARDMLGQLSGRAHTVISGIAVKEAGKMSAMLDADVTRVHIRALSGQEIADYVQTGEPMDKAGAYAAQGLGKQFISGMDGDYYNVVGLPVMRLLDMLDMFIDTSEYRARVPNLETLGFNGHQTS